MSGGGGNSGGGGGGQSGLVDYPAYMKTFHGQLLDDGAADTLNSSITDLINAAITGNPFSGDSAYDPATPITAMLTSTAAFNAVVDALSHEGDWESAMDIVVAYIDASVVDDTYINADIAAWTDVQDDERDTVVIPKFQAGMRDINAVMTSSFVVGEAIIEAFGARDAAKYGTELRMKLNLQRNEMIMRSAELILKNLMARVEFEKAVCHYTIEGNRLKIVALKEQIDQNSSIDEHEAKWPLDVMTYGGNMLASIAGAATTRNADSSGSRTRSMIGGALSGAAVGTAISPGWGTVIGAGIGAVMSM